LIRAVDPSPHPNQKRSILIYRYFHPFSRNKYSSAVPSRFILLQEWLRS
jgi:hypothetical protein